ncbi:MAG: peptidoglycan-binding protein [Clostridia bacterium]|nr:peptidoglycan-binding protein [Clostridia bacterium]
MPVLIPYIPETITVHLGVPNSDAENVTLPFNDYLKNVLSSEVYPTWEPAALEANLLAIASYVLNRIYTDYYRSRGYDFDITSTTAYDQQFVSGRNIYENISRLVDENFAEYLRRVGFVEPLAAKFCNGVTTTCDGLSQWGSQELAQQGLDAEAILRTYYGDDIEIVDDAPVQGIQMNYPETPIRRGDLGVYVLTIQTILNRVSQNYPAIPKVATTSIFDAATEASVRAFQSIFSLEADGIVGRATWYRMTQLYVAVLRLAELRSEGQSFLGYSWEYPDMIIPGETSAKVTHLQYMLSVLVDFIPEVQAVSVTGTYDEATEAAVSSFQRYAGLPETGAVDRDTWDAVYSQYAGIESTVFGDRTLFPIQTQTPPAVTAIALQQQLRAVSDDPDALPVSGRMDATTKRSLAEFQKKHGLPVTGKPTAQTKQALCGCVQCLRYAQTTTYLQFPGHDLSDGMRDPEVPL